MMSHPEWKKENTLTAPSDRDRNTPFRLDQNIPPLTQDETVAAMSKLNNTAFTKNFPEVERRYADPVLNTQRIGLVSFVPAKGATPNEQGIYGFAKLRGNFATEQEADEHAENLIRNHDSYHQIYHTYVGRPFPLTTSSDYSATVNRVDLQKQIASAVGEDVKKKREKEQKDIEEIKNREKELMDDVKKTEENRDDYYTTLKVKKAQLTWTYIETEKKMQQIADSIARSRKEIEDMDAKDPSLNKVYYDKYMNARKEAGLSTDKIEAGQSFIKYMVEDAKIQALDDAYNKLFGQNDQSSSHL